jgi:transcriptional antiterminator NusG
MRTEGLSETERDVTTDRADRDQGMDEAELDQGMDERDHMEDIDAEPAPTGDLSAPEEDRFEADDPVEVVAAQVTPGIEPATAETETYEPDPVDPQPVEPEPEPAEPQPEPVEPDPEPVEPDLQETGTIDRNVAEPAAMETTEEADEAVADVAPAAKSEPAPEPEEERQAEDPFRGHGDWYVVHTYSGYENKVKTNLESRIHTMQMEDKIFGVHIPMEDVMEIKSGKKQVVKKKQFPGYLLVRMVYDNDSWYVVRNTPGVTGFVSAGTGSKPTPLSKHEVEKILAVKKEEVRPQVRLGFEEGDVVRITSGPFADFNGTINEINPDQAKLKVLVNIFDRETPVELSFDQVSKV